MSPPRRRHFLSLALACALGVAGCGGSSGVVDSCAEVPDADRGCTQRAGSGWEPEWIEAQTPLPPLPVESDLTPIEAPRMDAAYDVLVDARNIVRGRDGVMRYTVVVRTPGGASNTFHEGLRCETDEVRTYAFATRGDFKRIDDTAWSEMASRGPRAYQDYLANVIMCDRNGYAWDPENARAALRAQYTAGGVLIERSCTDLQGCDIYNRSD